METQADQRQSAATVDHYLDDHNVLTLATSSLSGLPHSAMFHYVNDGLTFYVWSRPDTLTIRQVEANPAVSLTVGEYATDWRITKGVQASGQCRVLLDAAEITTAAALAAEKFPQLLPARAMNLTFLRITPHRVHFIDNGVPGTEPGTTPATTFHRRLVYSVFADLPHQTADAIAGRLSRTEVPAGQVIVRQGAPADKFFIIVSGSVEVIREDGGPAKRLATLQAGQFFGEVAILRDVPRTATVRALQDTCLLTMDNDLFRALVAQSLGTTQNFDEIMQVRMAGQRVAANGNGARS